MNYYINILSEIDKDGNVDVHVHFENGVIYSGVIMSIANLKLLMNSRNENNESTSSQYFWSLNTVIIESLSKNNINNCVASLIENDELEDVFVKCEV